MLEKNVGAVVLAAGMGKRMNSNLPKVLHEVDGLPMVKHVVDILEGAGIHEIVVIVGHGAEEVRKTLDYHHHRPLKYIKQKEQLGTADAVKYARGQFSGSIKKIIIIYGDTPLFTSDTIVKLSEIYDEKNPALVLVSFDADDPTGYGRVISDTEGHVEKIVEEKDARDEEKKIKEVNAGLYCFDALFLWENLPKVQVSEVTKEYYLTDLIGMANEMGRKIIRYKVEDATEALGVNNPEQLQKAHETMVKRKNGDADEAL